MHTARLVASLAVVVLAASSGCAEEPIFIPPETVGGSPAATSGGAGGGDGDGGDGPSSGPTGSGDASSGQGGAGTTGGVGAGGDSPAGTFAITLSGGESSIELRDSTTFTVSITATDDVGPLALGVEGLPDDLTATLDDDMPDVVAGTQTVELEIASASDTVTGTFAFTVRAQGPSDDATAGGAITVAPVLTIVIPPNLMSYDDDGVDTTAFGDYPTRVRALENMADNPITIHFLNADAVPNEIHADRGDIGFGHGQGPIPPGELDPVVRRVTAPAQLDYYPHNLGQGILGRIIIE